MPKNPHAVALGRKGGKRSLETMTPQERSERARKAVQSTKRFKRVMESMSKIEIFECSTCHKFIGKDEYDKGNGACYECWSK